jgi:long-chain fatty acid transport protein
MQKNILAIIILVLSHSIGEVNAGGFQVNLQNARHNAMGHAGTAWQSGAADVFFNPGALSFTKKKYDFNFGVNAAFPSVAYKDAIDGYYTTNNQSTVSTPLYLYGSYKSSDTSKFAFGIGVNNQFGSTLRWEDDWKGQFVIREISLSSFFIQPTVSYKISEKLGVGLGASFVTGNLLLKRGIPVANQSGDYGSVEISGSAKGYGFNIGVFYQLNEKISLGASYRSSVALNLNGGDAVFTVPNALKDSFPVNKFDASLALPGVINFGIALQATEKLKLLADINFTQWSVYDSLILDFSNNTELLEDTKLARNYKNVFAFRLGGSYDVNESTILRAGVFYDMTPVQQGFVTPDGPDANRLGLCIGASYKAGERFQIDGSLMYVRTADREGKYDQVGFEGVYRIRAIIPTIGLNYSF